MATVKLKFRPQVDIIAERLEASIGSLPRAHCIFR